ncbi:GNAT family N-acetyltransferase [Achromobacter aloeverae]|uniref:GNAT family N-acetyltransferase n=2 Tax=Achromobacter aloeverae TaxID=1750518 RepID=A0A4Q1HKN5_9BURK|nr:GNAT family N-acetyltransferase [Achromobacter aloeverae]
MCIDDYDDVISLMQRTPGVTFRDADSRESTSKYLERNPGLSFVARVRNELIGCVMCGHDGRRGYLQHLVVAADHRRKGVASALVERCLSELEEIGIVKTHIDVIKTNAAAREYWERQGWTLRTDIDRYSFVRNGTINA